MRKVAAIIEARMSSSRLPGKVLKKIGKKECLLHTIHRLKRVKKISDIIVATTVNSSDDVLVNLCKKNNISFFRGSEENVYERVLDAAIKFKVDIILEITGDSIFIDSDIIQESLDIYLNGDYDFVANCVKKPMYIPGFDARVFSTSTLASIKNKIYDQEDLEHVSSFFWKNSNLFKIFHVKPPADLSSDSIFLGLDTLEDLKLLKIIYKNLGHDDNYFDAYQIVDFLKKNFNLINFNSKINRNKV